jgi:hypothetical protein
MCVIRDDRDRGSGKQPRFMLIEYYTIIIYYILMAVAHKLFASTTQFKVLVVVDERSAVYTTG